MVWIKKFDCLLSYHHFFVKIISLAFCISFHQMAFIILSKNVISKIAKVRNDFILTWVNQFSTFLYQNLNSEASLGNACLQMCSLHGVVFWTDYIGINQSLIINVITLKMQFIAVDTSVNSMRQFSFKVTLLRLIKKSIFG